MGIGPGDTNFTNVNVAVAVKVGGTKVLGTQYTAIANGDPAGATMNNILVALRAHGLIAT